MKINKDQFLFVPLGGAGEIGMNLNLYHYQGKWLIADCGAGFAEDQFPGIEMIVPDINFAVKHKKDILGILITHIHEDHFGAVQYLWEYLECPIFATEFAANYLKRRLFDQRVKLANEINLFKQADKFALGPFTVELVPLCHSAPEMQALVIGTDKGKVFHTGDWKFDSNPIIGEVNDEELLKKYGQEGVLAVIGDSTNVFNEEHSGSEGALQESMHKIIQDCKGLVVVTTFASNLARVHGLLEIAKKLGKKVILAGKTLHRITQTAIDCNYLTEFTGLIVDDRNFNKFPRNELMIIATGCQGEPLAAVTKMANKSHPTIALKRGDNVIFSSKIIPGNEKKIFRLFNKLVELGIEVLTERDHFVHVSGHPSKQELAKLYNLLKPEIVIPVHGELIHMHEHAKFARSLGIKKVIEVKNGDVVQLEKQSPKKIGSVEARELGIYGSLFLAADSNVLKQRRRMRDDGIIFISVILSKTNKILHKPMVCAPGFLDSIEHKELLDYITDALVSMLKHELRSGNSAPKKESIEKEIRNRVKNIVKTEIEKCPDIQVLVQIV